MAKRHFDIAPQLVAEANARWQRWLQHSSAAEQLTTEQQQNVQWLFAVSEFVARSAEQMADEFLDCLDKSLPHPQQYAKIVSQRLADCQTDKQLGQILRQLRRQWMCQLCIADLEHQLPLRDALTHLTAMADAFIEQALAWLYDNFCQRFGTPYSESGEQQHLLVIAMGKLGGGELNFSSDIDLIFSYPEQGHTTGGNKALENNVFFTRLAQALIAALDQQTPEGRVFRVDMRLRPFGQSGPLVSSFSALEHYYQEQGRDWERYAMVKARVIGGERQQQALETLLRPFVYRRYIDFSAIEALRKMKLLIQQETRRQGAQDNIKLGRGGIREVEFIVQAHQLIRGGQEKRLQTRSLYQAYEGLKQLQMMPTETVDRLLQSYEFLRTVEHRLQQLNDEQTQQLPTNEADRLRLVSSFQYRDWDALYEAINQHCDYIHQQFLLVVGEQSEEDEEEPELQVLWQDMLDDDAAIELLQQQQVENPLVIWQTLQAFRLDARKRHSGPRGRRALARLVPLLLRNILDHQHPEQALDRILVVMRKIMTRTAYVELLVENPGAREQLIKLCTASPWITQRLAQFPLLLDELIDPQQLYQLPALDQYGQLLQEYLVRIPEQDLETQMDALRQAKQALQLKIAAADISGGVELMRVSDHLSFLAEAVIAEVVDMAWLQLVARHGTPPGCSREEKHFAVVAYGKLGGLELGYGSDLDLVFVTDADYSGQTDGAKPIDVQQFYLRLAQRILHLFTTRTVTGVLYDVDLRLRPSGTAGLLVTQLQSFARYLSEEAWTWELQALVRARCVYGSRGLQRALQDIRQQTLMKPRDPQQLREDILAMREKMRGHLRQSSSHQQFDLKQDPGGITDIEFITQFLVLKYAHQYPSLAHYSDNIRILTEAEIQQLLAAEQAQNLMAAYQILRCESHALALQDEQALSSHDLSQERDAVLACWRSVFQL
ncbi:bifunctional [glutamate--ammonia ligase]-adenylyl-L-tyrosine phosphorylase/[glutamate--ammonia-ligase] adenylyltransferase [Idiomarina tyrosinivorans]|uniref:Bifunctional glutamine synthetase adenylyltransferase/adenylyl-removing enzyme n=1 Tax=Idiomarina tyrosinivorans TaxID=1445662 RepID=A0A432ZG86_9GAMM|nr:bifunctional [glutamate--ammonia ligase]-adenylyl-L-tyrosine phosphorylase/[glutamate--ammonia-ligase] adenylyltransferase [Idiomarina tyrosinivorans]RUO76924.1 bifunctional [glutamate--ammonia ligase]-adenylyl-L-tyrosine phosphorylase/[glutamate--ammonia-ligase] adenylyltransferase [Idiomarina tyrosinivorans]